MTGTITAPTAEGATMDYLRELTEDHPGLRGYDIEFIAGVIQQSPGGEVHIIELDRKTFTTGEGRLYPIAFRVAPGDAEFVWVTMVSPEDLREVVDRKDKTLTEILHGAQLELLWPEEGTLDQESAELYAGLQRVWEEQNGSADQ